MAAPAPWRSLPPAQSEDIGPDTIDDPDPFGAGAPSTAPRAQSAAPAQLPVGQVIEDDNPFGTKPPPQTRAQAYGAAAAKGPIVGTGAMLSGAGRALQMAGAKTVTTQLGTLDRLDRGEAIPDDDDPIGYRFMTPEERAQERTKLDAYLYEHGTSPRRVNVNVPSSQQPEEQPGGVNPLDIGDRKRLGQVAESPYGPGGEGAVRLPDFNMVAPGETGGEPAPTSGSGYQANIAGASAVQPIGPTRNQIGFVPTRERHDADELIQRAPPIIQNMGEQLPAPQPPLQLPENALTRAGAAVSAYGEKEFPIAPERQGFATNVIQGGTGMLPILLGAAAATAAGAPEAALPLIAASVFPQGYDATFRDAIAHGATPQQADRAGLENGALQAATMSAPIGRLLSSLPAPIRDGAVRTLINMGQHGVEFGSFNAMGTFLDNYVANQSYDPQRPLTQGVAESGLEGAVTGMAIPVGTAFARAAGDTIRTAAQRLPLRESPPEAPSAAASPSAPEPPPGPAGLSGAAPAGPEASPPRPKRGAPRAGAPPTPGSAADVEAAVLAGEAPATPAAAPAPPTGRPGSGGERPGPGEPPTAPEATGAPPAPQASSQTPVPPTVPEPAADVHAQLTALADPKNPKDAVFLAAGTPLPQGLQTIDGLHIASRPEGTLLTTNPAKADAYRTAQTVSDPLMARLLGYPETKPEAISSGNPVVVQGTDPAGAVVAETLASPQGIPAAEAAVQAQTPPGGAVAVRAPEAVTDERAQETAAEGTQPPAPRLRTIDQIMREDGVGAKAAAATQADEIAAIGRPISMDEMAARKAGVAAMPPSAPSVPPLQPSEPRSGGYTMFTPSELTAEPGVMQFKASDEKGVTGALTGFSTWEPGLANPITVWQTNDGRNVVVNGHQRLDLAQRAEAAGQQGVQLPARVYREADGYSPEYMRALGAYQNIAEGSGTPLDVARVLRTKNSFPDNMRLPELPPHQMIVQQARGLAQLSHEAFGAVENGLVPPEYAGMVGAVVAEPAEQMAALDALSRGQPANANQARIMIADIRNGGFLQGAQTTLFGEEAFARSLVPERAKVLDGAMKILRSAAAAFRATVRGEKTLTDAGNVLATDANVQGKTASERLLDTIGRNATTVGPYSDALNVAARELAAGKPLDKAAHAFLAAARQLERGGTRPGVSAGDHGRGVGHAGEGEAGGIALGRRPPLPPTAGAPLFGETAREQAPRAAAEPTIRTDERQAVMPGMERSAVQAQAARDQAGRGALLPTGEQRPANEGLFAPKPPDQKPLFGRRLGGDREGAATLRASAVERYRNGESAAQVGRSIGASEGAVLRWLKLARVEARTAAETKGITESVRARAIDLYDKGNSVADVAKKLGIGGSTVHRIVTKEGIARPLEETTGVAPDVKPRALALYSSGMNTYEAAKELGVSQGAVARWTNEAGIARGYSGAQALRQALGRGTNYGIKATVQSAKAGGDIHAGSLYEIARIGQLEEDPSVIRIERAQDRIPHGDGRTYVPDLIVTYADGRRVAEEIKPEYQLDDPVVQQKAKAAEAFYRDRDIDYRLVTERTIGLDGFATVDPAKLNLSAKDTDRARGALATVRSFLRKNPDISPEVLSAVAHEEPPAFQRGAMQGHPDYPHPTAIQSVIDTARAITGGNIQIEAYDAAHHAFTVKFPDGHTEQVFGYAIGRLIRAAIEPGRFTQNLNHEVLHALKRLGVFTPQEWATLEAAAERGNWIKKHGVRDRYPEMDHVGQIEEAIADEMGDRAAAAPLPGSTPSFIARMLAKVRSFMARLRNMLARRGFQTADDVFGNALSGEVGAREPGSRSEPIGPQTVDESMEAARVWGLRDPNEVAPAMGRGVTPITAYHGSPHDFDRFDASKIGTGEGAQAYGHGLYFAQREGVARDYRDQLTNRATQRFSVGQDTLSKNDLERRLVDNFGMPTKYAAATLLRDVAAGRSWDEIRASSPQDAHWAATIDWLEKNDVRALPRSEGRMYQTALHLDQDKTLDWDRPFTQQPDGVKAALQKIPRAAPFVRGLASARDVIPTNAAAAHEMLHAGIEGIRYLDQGSRALPGLSDKGLAEYFKPGELVQGYGGHWDRVVQFHPGRNWSVDVREVDRNENEGPLRNHATLPTDREIASAEQRRGTTFDRPEGTRNYVVFDDKLIDIEAKFGRRKPLDVPAPDEEPEKAPPIKTAADMVARLERIPRIGHVISAAAEKFTNLRDTAQMMVTPMAAHGASDQARAIAKNYANLTRWVAWDYNRIIDWGRNTFKPDRLKAMWDAAGADSVEIQTAGKPLDPGHGGVADLHPDEQAAVKAWQADADNALAQARKVGMTEAEGLPSYAPRMVVDMVEGAMHPFGQGGEDAHAQVVRNMLTLPLATMHLRQAIAGRALINQIKAVGSQTGQRTVSEGGVPEDGGSEQTEKRAPSSPGTAGGQDFRTFGTNVRTTTPQLLHRKHLTTEETEAAANRKRAAMQDQEFRWFTIKGNPAFWTRRARLGTDAEGNFGPLHDENGNILVDRVPIYVRGDFEGPLKAVLHESASGPVGRAGQALYQGMMSLKGRMMTSIMYGVAHLGVIAGRAFPAAPNLYRVIRTGSEMKQDQATMRRLILGGMAPIGRTMGFRDLPGLIEDPQLVPGRSWTSKIAAFVPGLYSPKWSDATKRAIDRIGDVAHNKLLWDQVQNIQVGLAVQFEQHLIDKGMAPSAATRMAANFANIYAGALPREAMSQGARALANVLLFSRSYRLGNIAAIKAGLLGLPRDVRSQILREHGEGVAKLANSLARRKGIAVLMADMALYYIGNSLIQSAFNVMLGLDQDQEALPEGASVSERLGVEAHGYLRRLVDEGKRLFAHPQQALNPFGMIESLSALYEHEPEKRNRIMVGYDKDGTAEYMRNPTGKSAEDISDYFVRFLDTAKRMLSPFMRPIQEVWTNDLGFGHKVYDPMADMPTEIAQITGALTSSVASSTFPWAARLVSAYEGHETFSRALTEAAAAGLGTSISKGYPGGPPLGELSAARESHEFTVQRAMPGIRDMIRRGDSEGAAAKMTELGVEPGLQRYIFGQTENPTGSKRQLKDLMLYGTPEQQRRIFGTPAP